MNQQAIMIQDRMRVHAEFSRAAAMGARVRHFVRACEHDDDDGALADALELAVHEIAVNIVRHALAKADSSRIDVRLSCDTRGIVVTLKDDGAPFEPDMAPEPDLSSPHEGGYGLYLARQLVDHLEYRRTPTGNEWELRVDRASHSQRSG